MGRSVLLTGLGNLCSRISGLARDMLFSYSLGTSAAMSAFLYALSFPNLFRRVFGEGAMRAALIPLLSDSLKDSEQQGHSLASIALSITAMMTGTLALLSSL